VKIVIIDHYDSFTYNIVELIRQAVSITPDVIPSNDLILSDLDQYDKIILSPGPGLPRDFISIKHVLDLYKEYKSILGICLGHQGIAHYFGAHLENLKEVIHGQCRIVETFNNNLLFNNLPDTFKVGLYHSWVVSRNDFPSELKITALSNDGHIMGLEHKIYNIYGVQFHPESYITEHGLELIKNFINATN
jgi:anthranilate synthase/aminodeoxychorismate synthase-like glutamine amidotransferase